MTEQRAIRFLCFITPLSAVVFQLWDMLSCDESLGRPHIHLNASVLIHLLCAHTCTECIITTSVYVLYTDGSFLVAKTAFVILFTVCSLI